RLPDPGGTLYLAALLRIADALDHGHLQDAFLVSSEGAKRRIRFDVRSPLFPQNVELARRQAHLWRGAFPVDIDFRLLAGGLSRKRLLEPTLPLPEALRRLLFLQYRLLLLNVEGARGGEATEALHDLRIAIRRMRVILRAFAKPLAGTSAERIEAELQRLNRILGSARDLDVWIGFFSEESMAKQFAHHRLWKGFIGHQLELRRLQQATVRRHLHGAAFSSLRFRLGRFLRIELPELNRATAFKPVGRGARRAIAKALRRALDLADLRHSPSADKVHRLRIALRRLRYLGGSFERLLGPAARKISRRAHAVERILGGMRDADLALARILSEGPTPPRLLVRQLERLRRDEAAELAACWNRFEDPALLAEVGRQLER
ncbi:MAG TPA: CHAD domain-containing protein, partial [Opitutaceae bacterium]|nr:CHAD domain-containing protein [Opitutaceae bacterium]